MPQSDPKAPSRATRFRAALLAAAAASSLLTALPADLALSQPSGGETRPPRPPVDVALDANGDGVIDAAEIANAPAALKKLDTNGDGKLTPDELRPKRPDGAAAPPAPPTGQPGPPGEGQRPRRPRPPIEAALDVNGDGIIDAAEIAGAPAALKKLDRNRDGRLDPDEYRPPRPQDGQAPPAKAVKKEPR